MNQSRNKERGRIRNCKIIGAFSKENDLKITRANPEEWLISMGPCEDMPERDGRGE